MRSGIPVFRVTDGRLEVIKDCHFHGELEYEYRGDIGVDERRTNKSAADVSVSRFGSAGMTHEQQTNRDYKLVGAWTSRIDRSYVGAMQGPCPGATHVVDEIFVGAYRKGNSHATKGGGGIGVEAFGASTNHELSKGSSNTGGDIAACDSASETDTKPPTRCSQPIFVTLKELEKDEQLNYQFDGRVIGARTEDVPITTIEIEQVAAALGDQLQRGGGSQGLEIEEVSAPTPTDVRCRIAASTGPDTYLLECFRGKRMIYQVEVERKVLDGVAPSAANSLIDSADLTRPQEAPQPVRRVVVLVDVSLSMVVNDETTFLTDDIRRSKRYELVMLLLRGMQENGIAPDVAIATFGAASCMYPMVYGGKKLWALTDKSRDYALGQLQKLLSYTHKDCIDSTDLVGPMQMAAELLKAPDSRPGKDVVFLITDGAHQAQASKITPKVAAAELREIGAELTIIRVQLNDLTKFRAMVDGPDQADIIARWRSFYNASEGRVEGSWKHWIEDFPAQDDGGTGLLADVNHVDVRKFFLSTNDRDSDSLVMAHEQLLPQVGGLEPVFTSVDNKLETMEGLDGTPHLYTEYKLRAIRGRRLLIRIKKPLCMGEIVSAHVQAPEHGREKLRVLWEDGAIVTFGEIRIGDSASNQHNTNNEITLMVEGKLTGEMKRCKI
jgi:hypothetical protein